MNRRDFLHAGAVGAGGTLLGGAHRSPLRGAPTPRAGLPAALAALPDRTADAPGPITEAEREDRRARAQRLMAENGIDAVFIEPGANLTYFAGLDWHRSERTFGLLLPREGRGVVVSPAFERQRAEDQVAGRWEVRVWQEDESPFALIADALRGWGHAAGVLGVDESARYFIPFHVATAAPALRVVIAEPVTHALRGVKSRHEIDIMRFANEVTLAAYKGAFATLHEGMTQDELAANVTAGFEKQGFQGYALVLFDEASAYPHGLPHPRSLGRDQVVLIDGGMSVHGYQSDMTRTVVFGTPTDEMKRVWETVHRAQAAGLAAAAPGRAAGSVDAAARKVITDAGFGPDYRTFTHRLGHGIGLEGHEWPYLVRGSEVVLRPGMTFSDEPGIYQYGKYGFRSEDIIAITDGGAEMLTPAAPSLSPSLT